MSILLLVLLLQLLHVPAFVLRTIFAVKQLRVQAAALGLVEAVIYVFGLKLVFTGDQGVEVLLVYALGFSIGIYVGLIIEEKLAIGYTVIHAIIPNENLKLIEKLRKEGFGVSYYDVQGKDDVRYKLDILTNRNKEEKLTNLIKQDEPSAFIVSYEPRSFSGGFLLKAMKKRKKKKENSNSEIS